MADDATIALNPFPGLRPFRTDEAHLFFGREGQTDELLRRLEQHRFLGVVGTSGSGKSSLVRAGLLPALHGGFMTSAGSSWRIAVMLPGNAPFSNLAASLAKAMAPGASTHEQVKQQSTIESDLRHSAVGIIEATKHLKLKTHDNLLIVVDQFEELFRFQKDSQSTTYQEDATAFVKLLLEATTQQEISIYIVITMRSDFLGDCAQFRDLPEALNDSQYLIPRMTYDQRQESIQGPVAVEGGTITQRLVQRLLNDVGDDPDQLPVLQHALMRTWEASEPSKENGRLMDLPDYTKVGGMAQALSDHADEAYNDLPDDNRRKVAKKLFKCLTEKGPDNREIRRPTPIEQIAAVANATPKEVIEVIDQFRTKGRSFLMPPHPTPLNEESVIGRGRS